MLRFRRVKSETTREIENRKRSFEQERGNKKERSAPQGKQPPPPWKRLILGVLVGASISVIVVWAVFTVKPTWWAPVKGLIASDQVSPKKRARTQRPPQSVSKQAKGRKTVAPPQTTPGSGQGQRVAARTERPQTLAPGLPFSTPPPSTSPNIRPQVSIPSSPPGPSGVQDPAITTPAPTFPVKKEESELDEYLEIGTLYAQKGAYEKAEELFQRVTKENPSSAQARNNLGFVYLKQEKYDQAEGEFKEAMRIDPPFVLPYYNLACLYSRKGMDVEALIYLKRALNRDVRVKMWAATDEDFTRLRSDVVFQELVGISPTPKEEAHKEAEAQGEKSVYKQGQPQQADPHGHPQPRGPATGIQVETQPSTRMVSAFVGHAQEPPPAPQVLDKERDYIVQEGDTLWDISQRFYGDPFLWPRLWQHNQYVNNPHLIYPGDRIRLYPYNVLIEIEKKEAKPPTAEEVKLPAPPPAEEALPQFELVDGSR